MSLEDELIDHLASPESAMAIYKARLTPDLLTRDESEGKLLLEHVVAHIEKYGDAPSAEVIAHELGGQFTEPTSDVNWLIDQIKQRYRRNQAKIVTSKVAKLVVSAPEEALKVALDEFGAIHSAAADSGHVLDKDSWDDALRDYQRRIDDGQLNGITFGYDAIDATIGGLRPNQMAFLVGRPKSTKSWQLLQSAVGAARNGVVGTFITAELSAEEMYGRFQCMYAGVSYSLYQHGALREEDWDRLDAANEEYQSSPGRIDFVHPPHDARMVADLSLEARRRDAEVVWFDQFRFATPRRHYEKAHAEMESIVYDIKAACAHQPWYVAAQFNREAAGLTEMGDLSQIGLTDAIGQASDHVLGIYRSKDMIANRLLHLGVIATRGFEGGVWEILERIGKDTSFKLLERVA
jgi:replicative DNA helicase